MCSVIRGVSGYIGTNPIVYIRQLLYSSFLMFLTVYCARRTLSPSPLPPHTLMSVDDQRERGGEGVLAGIEGGGGLGEIPATPLVRSR